MGCNKSNMTMLQLLSILFVQSQAWSTIPTSYISRTTTALPTITTLHSSSSSNNIVFRPSTDPNSFDSLKIGTARIHRYASNPDSDDSEYVMWYHARSRTPSALEEEEGGAPLPPLSTGRIGRATSLNGLHWIRDPSGGSLSEDVPGVTLGLNAEGWWSFDTAHVGLGQVLLPLTTPAVMTEGGVYLMYYMGGNYDETPVGDYMMDGALEGVEKVAGMGMKIGVALSQDGITFGRVEGDDPSGAIMFPYDASDANMKWIAEMKDDIDGSPVFIEEELYCAYPDVVVNSEEERKKSRDNTGFFMYYSTMLKGSKERGIAVAVSDDGFRWFKRGVCVKPDSGWRLDDGGCASSTVVRNAVFADGVWEDADGWTMFYEGVSKTDGLHRILTARSADGRSWTKGGLVLDVGEGENAWDCKGVTAAHVIRLDDGSIRMYYTGQGADGSTAIGVAKCMSGDMGGGDCQFVRDKVNINF